MKVFKKILVGVGVVVLAAVAFLGLKKADTGVDSDFNFFDNVKNNVSEIFHKDKTEDKGDKTETETPTSTTSEQANA